MPGWFDILTGAVSTAGGIAAANRADKSSDASLEAIRAQIRAADRLAALGDEGGAALAEAFKAYIDNVGPGFSADGFEDAAGGIALDRAHSRNNIANAVDGFLARMSGPGGTRKQILGNAASVGPSVPMLTGGNYSDEIYNLAGDFHAAFDARSAPAVERLMSMQEADAMSRGMDRSTYGIQTRRAAADQVAKLSTDNMLKAVQAATQQVGRNQALDIALNNASLAFNSEAFKRNMLSLNAASDMEKTVRSLDLETIRSALANLGGVDALVGAGEGAKARQMAAADFASQAQLRGLTRQEITDLITSPTLLRANLYSATANPLRGASTAALYDSSQWQKASSDMFTGAGGAFQRWLAESNSRPRNSGVAP